MAGAGQLRGAGPLTVVLAQRQADGRPGAQWVTRDPPTTLGGRSGLDFLPSRCCSPAHCPTLPALQNIPRPWRSPGPMGDPASFPDSVSSSQLTVTNPSTEEAALRGWVEPVGKNTECAGTSHPIHHCPCPPVFPARPGWLRTGHSPALPALGSRTLWREGPLAPASSWPHLSQLPRN